MTTLQKTPSQKNNSTPSKTAPELQENSVPYVKDEQKPQPIKSFASLYSGPLPPPDFFERYNNTLPGAADRILTLAEDEAKHRRRLEDKSLNHNIFIAHIGQVFAFILGCIGLLGGIYTAYIGQPWVASIIVGSSLAALIGPFLKNWKSEKKEPSADSKSKGKTEN